MMIGRANLTPTALLALAIVLGEWTGLARAILRAPAYAAVLDVLLAGLFLVTMWWAWNDRARLRIHPLDGLVAAFFLLAVLQIFNPNVPSPLVGLEGFRKTAFTMLAYAIVRFSMHTEALPFFRIVAIGSIAPFLWAVRQTISPLPIELQIIETSGIGSATFQSGPVLRAFAPTASPFHLGILGGAVAVIAVNLARVTSPRYLAIAVLAGVALGISLTRANMLGAVAAFVAITLASAPNLQRLRTAARFTPVVATLGLAVLLTARSAIPTVSPVDPAGSPAPIVSGEPNSLPNPLEDRSLRFRFDYWAEHLQAIADRPLIGYGTSSAGDGFGRLYRGTGDRNFNPHSLYLKAALELGIVGLALILAILVVALRECRRAYARIPAVGLIGLGILVMTMVSGLSGPMLDAYPFNLLFWATIGWLVAVRAPSAALSPDDGGE